MINSMPGVIFYLGFSYLHVLSVLINFVAIYFKFNSTVLQVQYK